MSRKLIGRARGTPWQRLREAQRDVATHGFLFTVPVLTHLKML